MYFIAALQIEILGSLFQNGVESMGRSMEKPRAPDDVNDKMKPWQLTEIVDPVKCRMVTMPDSADASNKVCELLLETSLMNVL